MSQTSLSFQHKSLVQQGYRGYSSEQLRQLDWGLRFTPIVCSLLTLAGLLTQEPRLLFLVAALGVWAFFAPAAHPMDLLYNYGVRPLFKAVALPPNPFQRRLACLAAGVMNASAATLFLLGRPAWAWLLGGLLLGLQLIVITTHFCALSWIYELGARLLGSWEGPIELDRARTLLAQGAVLVDVREANEFARGHARGAVNHPLSTLATNAPFLKGKTYLVYCASGMRSQMACKQLKRSGLEEVYNVGGLSRAEQLSV